MVILYGFDPFFLPQWDPIGTKMDPNRWLRSSQKFEFWGMVIFDDFDLFFGPNGTPLAPRWTLGGPRRELAP